MPKLCNLLLQDNIKQESILGPFDNKPIEFHVSPFMNTDKPDSEVKIR